MLDIKVLANWLLAIGAILLCFSVFVWNSNKPSAPTARDRQMSSGSLLGSFAVNSRDREIAAYPKCLYQGSDYTIICPMNGSLHYFTWAGALLLLAGIVVKASAKPKPD